MDLSHRGAALLCEMQWTGKFQIVRLHIQIEQFIQARTEVHDYPPTPAQQRCLENALSRFWNFESIATTLQMPMLMIEDVRLYDTLWEDHPEMAKYLSIGSTVVHNLLFDNAIIRLMKDNERHCTAIEQSAVK